MKALILLPKTLAVFAKQSLLWCVLTLSTLSVALSQVTYKIEFYPNNGIDIVCPASQYEVRFYKFNGSNQVNLPSGCTINWTVTKGVFVSTNTTTANTATNFIFVKPDDDNDKLKVTATTSCTPTTSSDHNKTATSKEVKIKSLKNIQPAFVFYPNNFNLSIPLCSQQTFDPTIGIVRAMRDNGNEWYRADSYEWEPASWIISGFPNENSVIMRNPICSPNTTVRVRGKMQCDNFTSYSNYAVLNISRPGLPTSITGPDEIPQGVTTLQQYGIPEINCALDPSQYVWSLPNNWSGPTQGRNVQITPASCTGGNISLTVNCTGGGSFTLSKTISRPPFVSFPSISGDNFICNSPKTYSLINLPVNSSNITWSEEIFSNPAKFQFPSGTQGSSVVVSNNYNGNGVLKATISNPCGSSTSTQTNIRVGTYTQSEMQPITGPSSPCIGVQSTYYSPYLSPNNADYDWQISSPWQFSTYKDASAFYVTPYYLTFAQISLKVRNACGWPSIPALLSINVANCGSYRYGAGPNPVKGKLTVTASWVAKQTSTAVLKEATKLPNYTTKLYDEKGLLYYEGTTDAPTVEIDMRTYPKGVYYLHIGSGSTWEKIRVLKE